MPSSSNDSSSSSPSSSSSSSSNSAHSTKIKTGQHKSILIAGGSGFIGSHLAVQLCNLGYSVSVVGRDVAKIQKNVPFATPLSWNDLEKNDSSLPSFVGIINLAGHSIAAGRWTKANKQRLMDSRISTVQSLIKFCENTQFTGTFINASAIGYYGNQGDSELTESFSQQNSILQSDSSQTDFSQPGPAKKDFSQTLCATWEAALQPILNNSAIRLCIARFGVVLSNDGGAFSQMSLPFKAKLAVQNGDGKQWFSWIALEDAIKALTFLLETKTAEGVFNLVSPKPLTNAELTQHMAAHYSTLVTLPAPATILRLAMGQMADELLLASQRVLPKQLQAQGFEFTHNEFSMWLKSL